MAIGIEKKELEKKKVVLDELITTLEKEESINSSAFSKATSAKYRLRKEITEATQERERIIALIAECKKIEISPSIEVK
jgi:hypothetical protein